MVYQIPSNVLLSYPDIAQEWHPTKNGNLTPRDDISFSKTKVWWLCKKGHAWKATVNNRLKRNRLCPYCCGRLACPENNLHVHYPSLAKEWHPTKNGSLTPRDVLPFGDNGDVWWLCKRGHEWEAKINQRCWGDGCPYCAERKSLSEILETPASLVAYIVQSVKACRKNSAH